MKFKLDYVERESKDVSKLLFGSEILKNVNIKRGTEM